MNSSKKADVAPGAKSGPMRSTTTERGVRGAGTANGVKLLVGVLLGVAPLFVGVDVLVIDTVDGGEIEGEPLSVADDVPVPDGVFERVLVAVAVGCRDWLEELEDEGEREGVTEELLVFEGDGVPLGVSVLVGELLLVLVRVVVADAGIDGDEEGDGVSVVLAEDVGRAVHAYSGRCAASPMGAAPSGAIQPSAPTETATAAEEVEAPFASVTTAVKVCSPMGSLLLTTMAAVSLPKMGSNTGDAPAGAKTSLAKTAATFEGV